MLVRIQIPDNGVECLWGHAAHNIPVCIKVDACIYIYMYVYMCYVLIRPPIPYITSSRCKRDLINFVLNSFYSIRRLTQGPPLGTSSRCKRLNKFRPKKFLLRKRTNPRVPPCNDLNNLFFKIYEVITLYFFKLFLYKIYDVITS
jgi:hypothetical protein